MKCGVCLAPLTVRGYRKTGGRNAPLYHPCPRLEDPTAHPARHRGKPPAGQLALPSLAPFPVGSKLRFRGTGPFARMFQVGTETAVARTIGARSIFEIDGEAGAIWPEHAGDWQDVTPTRAPLPPPFEVGTRVRYQNTRRATTGLGPDARALIEPGMEVEIVRVVPGYQGTGRQLHDEGGPMVDDNGEPIVDSTADGHSVYEIDDGVRRRGRTINARDAPAWEVL
jgi:hypothetical protein